MWQLKRFVTDVTFVNMTMKTKFELFLLCFVVLLIKDVCVAMSAPSNASHKRWLPLEANPEVMNHFCGILGLDITQHSFSDVYGLDPDMLSFIPGPVRAILLLFPTGAQAEEFKQEEQRRIEQEGQILSEKVYFVKQNIGNACGTIALLHSIFNNMDRLKIKEDSFLSRFYELSLDMTPFQRAELLENPKEDQPDIEKAHEVKSCFIQFQRSVQ